MGLIKYLAIMWVCTIAYTDRSFAQSGVFICNSSTTVPLYFSQAFKFNWGSNYEVSGWNEVGTALGFGSLGHRCTQLVTYSGDYTYFALAHADEAGRFSLYQYEFELGGEVKPAEKWMCVSPTTNFRFRGPGLEQLARCEAGAVLIPFLHVVRPYGDDRTLVTVNPQPASTAKINTFPDMARGRYGAFAVSSEARRFGHSNNRLNASFAAQAALDRCGVPSCKVAHIAQAKCLAISYDERARFKIGAGETEAEASNQALADCKKAFGPCVAPVSGGCSGAR